MPAGVDPEESRWVFEQEPDQDLGDDPATNWAEVLTGRADPGFLEHVEPQGRWVVQLELGQCERRGWQPGLAGDGGRDGVAGGSDSRSIEGCDESGDGAKSLT